MDSLNLFTIWDVNGYRRSLLAYNMGRGTIAAAIKLVLT